MLDLNFSKIKIMIKNCFIFEMNEEIIKNLNEEEEFENKFKINLKENLLKIEQVNFWKCKDVCNWLIKIDPTFKNYEELFLFNKIDGSSLIGF